MRNKIRLSGIFALTIFFSFSAFADITPEERCEKQGEVAKEASSMRISGLDKETATDSLIKKYDRPDTGLTEKRIQGTVMVSYMAKMKPEKARDYVIDQCKKDILN